jgi:acyl carrier protein
MAEIDVTEKLRRILVTVAGLSSDFPPRADLYLDLGVPSVAAMQLLLEIEDQFGVQVPDEQFVAATSLEMLATMVTELTLASEKSNELG